MAHRYISVKKTLENIDFIWSLLAKKNKKHNEHSICVCVLSLILVPSIYRCHYYTYAHRHSFEGSGTCTIEVRNYVRKLLHTFFSREFVRANPHQRRKQWLL